jgi:hypothetical protein
LPLLSKAVANVDYNPFRIPIFDDDRMEEFIDEHFGIPERVPSFAFLSSVMISFAIWRFITWEGFILT